MTSARNFLLGHYRIGYVILFVGILFFRSPDLFLYPRFWAEEGRYYYASLQSADFSLVFKLVVRGNFQLLTNFFGFLATQVPAKYAAHVTTYFSVVITSIMVLLIGKFSVENKWSINLGAMVILIIGLLPSGYEIYCNATNLQWVCSVSILIISVLKLTDLSKSGILSIYVWSFLAGLTGVGSVMLTPFFLMRRWIVPSERHLYIGIILIICAIVHFFVIFSHSHHGRLFSYDAYTTALPIVLQTIIAPIVGADFVDQILQFGERLSHTSLTFISFLIIILFVLGCYIQFKKNYITLTLVSSWILVSTLNIFGSIGDPYALISGWVGGRYFYLGSIALLLIAGLIASNLQRTTGKIATASLFLILVTGVGQVYLGHWKDWLIRGNSWESVVLACGDARPCKVFVWPGGVDWTFDLVLK
jgi:hypothetical protein